MLDVNKIINELHIYEKKVLKALKSSKVQDPKLLSESENIDIKSVMSAAGSLASKNLINVEKNVDKKISLSKQGLSFAVNGLPERKLLSVLVDEKSIPVNEINTKIDLDQKEIKISIGWLIRKKWAKIDDNVLMITDLGEEYKNKPLADEKFLDYLNEKTTIDLSSLNDSFKKGFDLLNSRKNILDIDKISSHNLSLTDEGKNILATGFSIQKEATQVTHDQLKTSEWKNIKYRPYDINAEYPIINAAKMHPLRRTIEQIREIFIDLGFTEDNGSVLESAFWNFDSLFQPQDHAAREMQDTFYVTSPLKMDLPEDKLVDSVASVHEDGGDTGSDGWGYKWDTGVAKQSVLRTHTTGLSIKYLKDHKPPLKMFSVGRVFRRETITYKHLPEFHQVEGIVAGDNINFKNLLGIINEFYKKLGFKVRFRPAYFPYTYLSMECEVYLPEKKSWIELGGSGMFRPEVLSPLGVETQVAAFGLGIERLAMLKLGISDIRMLYKSDIGWLRDLSVSNGVDID